MQKVLLILVITILTVNAVKWYQLEDYNFKDYVKEHNKIYQDEAEYIFRNQLFDSNLAQIKINNQDKTRTWKEGVNQFTDRNPEELKRMMGINKAQLFHMKNKPDAKVPVKKNWLPEDQLPVSIDWRTQGVVTAVKDQGDCGSCWTFATAETIESNWAIASGKLTDLSEQQIADCTNNPNECGGTGGCGGGTIEVAMASIIKMGGLPSEWTYPYVSYNGNNQKCANNQSASAPMVQLTGYETLPSNQYLPLMNQIQNGPVGITIDASAWSSYESGVFDGCNQTNPDLDHGVQMVGYGVDPQFGAYWLIRNSWSPNYGEQGYIRIARTPVVQCGIDVNPSDGVGCKNGPKEVTVCGTCGILYDNVYPIM